jgi:hypothetical protein
MRKLITLGLFALLVSPFGARADRIVSRTMGRYIQQSAVLPWPTPKKSGSRDDQTVLEFREFLKGRAGPSERIISIRWACLRDGVSVQGGPDGVAVLLPEDWRHIECPFTHRVSKAERNRGPPDPGGD